MKKIIIIPVYKATPDKFESKSFSQCLNILFRHPICIVTHRELDTTFYIDLLKKKQVTYSIEFFDKSSFENIAAYNRLMKSIRFYERFRRFDYMLIYQLDAYVFNDELDYWCKKDFYYIGAPWFDFYGSQIGEAIVGVGNGGFSLRKIKTFISILENFKYLNVLDKYKSRHILKFLLMFFILFLRDITAAFFADPEKSINFSSQEDGFWYSRGEQIKNLKTARNLFVRFLMLFFFRKFKVADPMSAVQFSFETKPELLFKMNSQMLPFGCHAWQTNSYDTFYKKILDPSIVD
jgi:hypothetical protein